MNIVTIINDLPISKLVRMLNVVLGQPLISKCH